MNIHTQCAALLMAASMPLSVSAALFDLSDVELTAFATFSTQLALEKNDSDARSAPFRQKHPYQGGSPGPCGRSPGNPVPQRAH
jgi:hypothetical protein